MKQVTAIALLILFLILPAGVVAQDLLITQPSANETRIAEMRDFYVYGIFSGTVVNPGNVRIEVYSGDTVTGTPIRVVESHVDPVNGTTNDSVIDTSYANASWTSGVVIKVPDLVKEPGGIRDPTNKVVVTNRYYLGEILGGVTKSFDTNYTDSTGATLTDMKAGNYTIEVTGLSGNLSGQKANTTIIMNTTSTVLGSFRNIPNKNAITQYGITHNLRTYFDWFPGYFQDPDNSSIWYQADNRWTPNNGIEIVNDRPGTIFDVPAIANNSLFLYNVNAASATYGVELANILRFSLEDGTNTTFIYYDIGEPSITYKDAVSGTVKTISGIPATFPSGKRLVLTRADIFSPNGTVYENLFDPNDATTARIMNTNPAGGISIASGQEFVLYGVTKPISSAVSSTSTPYKYTISNRTTRINCTITDTNGNVVSTGLHDVNLSRLYTSGSSSRFNSLWEFGIEVTTLSTGGTYTISLSGLDAFGNTVPDTATTLSVTVSPAPTSGSEGGTLSGPSAAISPGASAGQSAQFTFAAPPSGSIIGVQSVTLWPSKTIGESECIVQSVTPGSSILLTGRSVAGYQSITMNWINPDAIGHADIVFAVRNSWLTGQNLAPEDIVVLRYANSAWTELPTVMDTKDDTFGYYRATTPGFSYFVVANRFGNATSTAVNGTGNVSGAPSPGTGSTGATGSISRTTAVPTALPTTGTAAVAPVVTATPAQSSLRTILFPETGLPLITIAAWILVILLIIILVYLIRRWWIRRQNPALFRKYN
ncbi:MAG: PGF-pre-PGF domain-containing protein [Methanoregulaceae archaeon]